MPPKIPARTGHEPPPPPDAGLDLRVLSFFSGIGGFDLGFAQAGFTIVGHVESDPQASAVLARRFPGVPNYGDINAIEPDALPDADVWVGGFPCTDLSVAGRREGLAGSQSGLWYAWHRLLRSRRPRWVVIENVPGLFSSHDGRDFAVLLAGLAGRLPGVPAGGWASAGFVRGAPGWYAAAWRVLDAQYFGLAQQRKRVFIVGCLAAAGGRCAEVLFERQGSGGHPPSRPAAGATAAAAAPHGARRHHRGSGAEPGAGAEPFTFDWQAGVAPDDRAYPVDPPGRTRSLTAIRTLAVAVPPALPVFKRRGGFGWSERDDVAPTLEAEGGAHQGGPERVPLVYTVRTAQTGANGWGVQPDVAPTLDGAGAPAVGPVYAVVENQRHEMRLRLAAAALVASTGGRPGRGYPAALCALALRGSEDPASALTNPGDEGGSDHRQIATHLGVRRLTPVECERLQGFPDDWTGGQSDSARYRQLGNAVAVSVAAWLAQRLAAVIRASPGVTGDEPDAA